MLTLITNTATSVGLRNHWAGQALIQYSLPLSTLNFKFGDQIPNYEKHK